MGNLKNLFSFLMLVIAFSFTACKPEVSTISISGTVSNDTTGLEGVTITASSGETTTSEESGAYTITASKEGTLTFTMSGYTSKTMDINNQTNIDVTLTKDLWVASFNGNGNSNIDPNFPVNSIIPSTTLSADVSTDTWFSQTATYKGAVAPAIGTPWYEGWSFYSRIVSGNTTSAILDTANKTIVSVNDAWMQAQGSSLTWTPNNIYLLDGFVFVASGQTLNIDAGTIIQGKAGTGANASALIIARGGKINAIGTATSPIVFTYEGDNGGSEATDRGKWGGLIILGAAGLNSTPGETQIEGIPTSETRGLYGGSINEDNSGTLRYVSIRHGGSNIGNDNEINGLTLGGVGSATTLEYIEIVANKDDGVEWFGGTANIKYLISAYCGDDALDYDEGYRGKNQFIIIHQDPAASAADRGGEHDGGTSPETGTPFATPQFWNVTSTGNTTSKTITFRDNAGGEYHNSIFVNFGKGIDIEDLEGQEQDSYKQFIDGKLKIANCVFFNIGAGTTGTDLFTVSN